MYIYINIYIYHILWTIHQDTCIRLYKHTWWLNYYMFLYFPFVFASMANSFGIATTKMERFLLIFPSRQIPFLLGVARCGASRNSCKWDASENYLRCLSDEKHLPRETHNIACQHVEDENPKRVQNHLTVRNVSGNKTGKEFFSARHVVKHIHLQHEESQCCMWRFWITAFKENWHIL